MHFFRDGLLPSALLLSPLAATAYQTCSVPFGGAGIDDSIALRSMVGNCSTNAEIVFEPNTTYNISTPVDFGNLSNVEIKILGNLDLPRSIPYVQQIVNASGGRLYWFTLTGTNITLSGNQDPNWGIVNSYGYPWYQAAPNTQPLGGLANRPHGWAFNANNSVIRWMKLEKPIAWSFSIHGNNNHIYSNRIDAAYDLAKPAEFPFNTDGYDVSGNNILIEDQVIYGGDDSVAVNQGNNITYRNSFYWGGHGASLSAATGVSNVLFDNLTSVDCLYGARFKSSLNAKGNIYNVTWSNMKIINATYPIFATGVYYDQNTNRGKTPGPLPANSTATHISGFKWVNISGTINDVSPGDGSCTTNPCWYYVQNVTNNAGVTLQLLNGTATDVRLENINLRPVDGQGVSNVLCDPTSFTDGTANLGFQCVNGPYVPV